MANALPVSGTDDPYSTTYYTPESNDKNTLTITSFFKLLAAQLQNQDASNPMDNSEMMAQMTQMAMVQSLNAMTGTMQTSTAINTQTYAAGLVGQEITVAVTEENAFGQPVPVSVKYGKVESVSFIGGSPIIKLEGDEKEYSLSFVLGMGKIEDPYAEDEEDKEDTEEDTEEDKEEKIIC